ncbi:MAG: hypothetical protein J2P58_01850 [Acidimicrobiaceae bacterium]|nr:hypothetical protein [Acidimicrobiaceae bacterium]
MAAPEIRGRHPRYNGSPTARASVSVPPDSLQTRAAPTGVEAELINEARTRIDAAAAILSRSVLGDVDPGEILMSAIRLIDRAERLIDAASAAEEQT